MERIEEWYNECIERHLAKFHELAYRSIVIGLLPRYIPIERSLTTQLDREIERLGLSSIVPWKNDRLPATHPPAARCLVPMTRHDDLNEILARSLAGYKESRAQIQNATGGEFDSEDDVPLAELLTASDVIALKNKLAEGDAPDLPRPNWEEEDDDFDFAEHKMRWGQQRPASFGFRPGSEVPSSSNAYAAHAFEHIAGHRSHLGANQNFSSLPSSQVHSRRSSASVPTTFSDHNTASSQLQQKHHQLAMSTLPTPNSSKSKHSSSHEYHPERNRAGSISRSLRDGGKNQDMERSAMQSSLLASDSGFIASEESAGLTASRDSIGAQSDRTVSTIRKGRTELGVSSSSSAANLMRATDSPTPSSWASPSTSKKNTSAIPAKLRPDNGVKPSLERFNSSESFTLPPRRDAQASSSSNYNNQRISPRNGGSMMQNEGGGSGSGISKNRPIVPGPGGARISRMDTFFDDLDDDREEDLVIPVGIEENSFAGSNNEITMNGIGQGANSSGHVHPNVSRNDIHNSHASMNRSGYQRGGASDAFIGGMGNIGNNNHSNLAGSQVPIVPSPPPQLLGTWSGGAGGGINVADFADPTAVLKREWSELYRDLHLLKQFAMLNMEAISKLLNKHDKNISSGAKHRFLQLNGARCAFLRREHLKLVIRETEHVYAQAFTGGHRTAAMQALRVSSDTPEVGLATFRFGFFLGISLVMTFLIAFVCVITDSSYLIKLRPGLIVFRMLTLATFLMWSWGLTIVACVRHRINITRIFEFHERPLYQHVFEAAAFLTLVLTTSMLIYVAGGLQQFKPDFEIPLLTGLASIPLALFPLIVCLLFLVVILFMLIRSKWWSALSFARVLLAPFFPITYQDFHTGEMLLSSCILLYDLQFSICYFVMDSFRSSDSCQYRHQYVNALVALLPSAWRMLQCLRRWADLQETGHLLNAGKYALGIAVTLLALMSRILGNLGNFWIALWFIAVGALVIFASYWDIIQDWALGESQVKYPGLRSTLLLSARWYYFAICITPLGRLIFALTISPDIISYRLNADVFVMLLATIEIARKTMWVIFRLENEQLQNADNLQQHGFEPEQAYPDFFAEDMLDAEFV